MEKPPGGGSFGSGLLGVSPLQRYDLGSMLRPRLRHVVDEPLEARPGAEHQFDIWCLAALRTFRRLTTHHQPLATNYSMKQLVIDKGMISRLALRPDVTSRNWYFGVACSGCMHQILILTDTTNSNLQFVGEGLISTPCPDCRTDTTYSNALVHGRFGGADEIATGVAWINATHLTQHTVRVQATGVTPEALEWLRSKVYVYELADLEKVAQDLEHLHLQIKFFNGYLKSDDSVWRAQRYAQLCEEPRIQQELSLLTAHP